MRRLPLVVILGGLALGALPAAAQDDTRALSDRLDRLERDLSAVQRQVYRGGGSPPAGGAPVAGVAALNTEQRLTQLEDQMRQLNGRFEEIGNNLDQLKNRLDKLSSDVDLRLNALEHGAVSGAPPTLTPPAGPLAPLPPQRGGANPPPGASGVLGQIPAPPPGQVAQNAAAPASGGPPDGTAQQQYDFAYGLLRRADYPGAEQALRAFVQRFPKDPLTGNAQYWLGETFYVRGDYNNAAIAFAEGYQKYPKSPKAADDLLKLAMSLGSLGQKANACSAFARLDRDFPQAPGNLKDRAAAEKQHYGC